MNIRMIALPLLCSAHVVLADEPARPPVEPAPSDAMPAETRPVGAAYRRGGLRRLPSGDLRYCLELGDKRAVIRCAEGRR